MDIANGNCVFNICSLRQLQDIRGVGTIGFHAEVWLNAVAVSMSMIKAMIEYHFQNVMKTSPGRYIWPY